MNGHAHPHWGLRGISLRAGEAEARRSALQSGCRNLQSRHLGPRRPGLAASLQSSWSFLHLSRDGESIQPGKLKTMGELGLWRRWQSRYSRCHLLHSVSLGRSMCISLYKIFKVLFLLKMLRVCGRWEMICECNSHRCRHKS